MFLPKNHPAVEYLDSVRSLLQTELTLGHSDCEIQQDQTKFSITGRGRGHHLQMLLLLHSSAQSLNAHRNDQYLPISKFSR